MLIKVKTSTHFPKISTARMVLIVAAVFGAYFVAGGVLNAIRAHQLRQEEARLQADIGDLEGRYERLLALKDYLNSEEYIEAVAREQLGLVRKGETGFVAISTLPSPAPEPGDDLHSLWWEVLIR